MAREKSALGYRQRAGESQLSFWLSFGVTQSGASRYEANKRRMPKSLRLLLALYESGVISKADLAAAADKIELWRGASGACAAAKHAKTRGNANTEARSPR